MIVDIADGKTEGSITLDQGSFKMVDERNRIALGKDVVIGGEGMKAFYDRILKNFTEKYIKKWGRRSASSRSRTSKKPDGRCGGLT